MENTCSPAPVNKKEYISALGKVLVKEYGKKKYYKPEEIKQAPKKNKWYHDILDVSDSIELFSCWGMSTFSSHKDFDEYHEKTGETCDYVAMKKEMLSEWTTSSNFNWSEIPDIDIDTSWLDFGDAFDGALDSLEFIGDIFG